QDQGIRIIFGPRWIHSLGGFSADGNSTGTMAFQAVDFRSKSSPARDRQTSRLMNSSGSTSASF
ncbi:MAG: hypothetical protein WD070_05425, partial [Pirellulaceae bacterium]